MKHIVMAAGLCGAAFLALTPEVSLAQASSYTPTTVWNFTEIRTLPGQDENYLDWLAGNWKKIQELGKKEGLIVSYHVFRVNAQRRGEADLVLAIELKDYTNTAQQAAFQKKVEAMLAGDAHKLDTQQGERKAMREILSSTEMQELQLK